MSGKENLCALKMPDSLDNLEGSLEDYISMLYDHQKLCQKQKKYIEADLAKKKLVELKGVLQDRVKVDTKARHQQETGEVERAHLQEFNEFNQYWDNKIQDYEVEALGIDQQIRTKHQQEMESFQEDLEQSIGLRPKQTSEIINLRRIEQNLAKQESYQEAHRVQQRITELQKTQVQKWNQAKILKIKNLLQQLQHKQDTELSAARQKIESGYQLQKKARETELQKLVQKYHNFMKELQNQHHQEITRLEKSIKNQSFLSASVSRASSTMSRALTTRNR